MKISLKTASLLLAPAFLLAVHKPAVAAQNAPTAITGGKLLTVSHGTIENGTIILTDGKISAVGETGKVTIPANAIIVDAKGLTVYPGLIDPTPRSASPKSAPTKTPTTSSSAPTRSCRTCTSPTPSTPKPS